MRYPEGSDETHVPPWWKRKENQGYSLFWSIIEGQVDRLSNQPNKSNSHFTNQKNLLKIIKGSKIMIIVVYVCYEC